MTKLLTYIFIFFFTFISFVSSKFADITGVDVGDVKTMLSTEPIGGSFDKDGKDIYLNDNYVSGDVESGLGVFGHEIGHSMYGDDEATAGYLGSRFADAYTDGLWINGEDSKLGSWNVADGNSLYVGQNGSDFAKVKNRDDCGPLCLTVFGIGAIISGIGAYKGGEAKAIVDYGYLGNNEYMRPDGSHISGEDLETNLKIYGTMDIGGGLLMGAGSLMKASPSGKGASVVNSIKSDKVSKVTNDIKKFLGNDVKVIKNKSGDTVFMGKDGAFTKKVRFDLNNPHPHKNPHTHVEIFKDNQKFYKSGQIYLKDVSKY